MRFVVLSLVAVQVFALMSAAQEATIPAGDSSKAKAENPHRRANKCTVCHEKQGDTLQPILVESIEAKCMSCHDGERARVAAHPSGRIQPGDDPQFKQPDGWPLVKGKINCITCHDVRLTCDKQNESFGNQLFLRSRWVGKEKQTFCQNCHVKTEYSRFVPHIMIKGSNDILKSTDKPEIDETTCLFCHLEVPDRAKLKRTGNPRLRATQTSLCKVCHPTHQTFYNPGHMGTKLPPRTLAYIYARELLGTETPIKNEYLTKLEESGATPIHTSGDRNGAITCSTCHNPHQEKVFPEGSDMNYDLMWMVGPEYIKSPTANKAMCDKCHL